MAYFGGDTARYANARERAIQKQRDAESYNNMLQDYNRKNAVYNVANTLEETIDIRRKKLELEQLAREEAMETMTRTAMLEARRKKREQEQEQALALELERQNRERESKLREIQRICEADPGLRELQSRLQMAYISKERAEQIKEREVLVAQEKAMENAMGDAMEQARLRALEAEKEKERQERQKAEDRRRAIETQLEERRVREFLASEEEAARERAIVEDILRKLKEEDEAEAIAKRKARDELVGVIEEFKEQRARTIEAMRQQEREDMRRIQEYQKQKESFEHEVARAKAEDMRIREEQYRKIVREEEERRRKQEEEDALRWILVEEETERRRIEDERRRKEAMDKARREMLEENERQITMREQLAAEERTKEARLIEQFLEKCRLDEEKERIAKKAREEAKKRYMEEIAEQRDYKAALYEAQRLREIEELEEAKRNEEYKRKIIAEARRKLLQEHAAVLRGHLPRGVILSNEDLNIIKAFDRDGDGHLTNEEMELAQAAFEAYDPADRPREQTNMHQQVDREPTRYAQNERYSDYNNANQETVDNQYHDGDYGRGYSQGPNTHNVQHHYHEPIEHDQRRATVTFAPQDNNNHHSVTSGGNSGNTSTYQQPSRARRHYANQSSISFGGGDWDDPESRRR